MGGGGESTAERYAKFGAGEYSSSDFERYVDSRPDLAAAWAKIESDPTAWDSKYWIDKGATSKSAFGRAHAAEDAALYAGTYGDSGDTKVLPGTPEYEVYFGDGGGTYFDSFISSPSESGGGGGSSMVGPGNPYYPQRVSAFTPRTAQDWSAYMPAGSPLAVNKGILYQADINSQGIPDSIWNYQPPMLYASGGGGGLSIGTGGGGGLSIGTTGGGHFIPTGMLSVESPPVGSAGYPVGDPRNPEDRGGPDRPGADSDTQTRHDPTPRSNPGGESYPTTTPAHYPTDHHPPAPTTPHFSTITFPSEVAIEQGFVSTPTLAQDIEANKAKQKALAQIRAAEKAEQERALAADIAANKARQKALADIAAAEAAAAKLAAAEIAMANAMSDYQVDMAQAELAAAAKAAASAGLLGSGGGAAIGKQISRYSKLPSVASVYGNPGGGQPDSAQGGGAPGGPGGPAGGGHSRK